MGGSGGRVCGVVVYQVSPAGIFRGMWLLSWPLGSSSEIKGVILFLISFHFYYYYYMHTYILILLYKISRITIQFVIIL